MSLIIPNTFADKSGSIQLSLLDDNFTEVATSVTNLSLSTLSGTTPITNGGTGEITRQAAMDALAGATTSGLYLRGNGTDVVMSAIQTVDIPNATSGNWFSGVAKVAGDGVMEVGRYLDFHSTNAGTTDYDVRLDCSSAGNISFGNTNVSATTFTGTLSGQGASTLASGATLSSPDAGSIYAPGMIIQTVYKRVDTKAVVAFATAGQTGSFITDLDTVFTPKFANSLIHIQMCLTYEVHWDSVFRLYRGATAIGINANDSNYWSGTWLPSHDGDNASTPHTKHFFYMDAPGSTAAITYRLMIQSGGIGATSLYLNRSVASAGQQNYEVAISQIIIQEIKQ